MIMSCSSIEINKYFSCVDTIQEQIKIEVGKHKQLNKLKKLMLVFDFSFSNQIKTIFNF